MTAVLSKLVSVAVSPSPLGRERSATNLLSPEDERFPRVERISLFSHRRAHTMIVEGTNVEK